jgi:hypothetical protein
MFTKEQLEQKMVEITEQCKKDFEVSKEQFLNWNYGDNLPEYVTKKEINSGYFEDCGTPDEMIEMLNEFKDRVEGLPYHIRGVYIIEINPDGGYIVENNYIYSYYVHKDEVSEHTIKTKVKKWINGQLRPESEPYTQSVDCKLLELFKEGTIDFKALQKLTYTNCDL